MKIAGALVSTLIKLNPEPRGPHVVCEKTMKALCMQALRAICRASEAALLRRKRLRLTLEAEGFKFDERGPRIANHQRKGSQRAILLQI